MESQGLNRRFVNCKKIAEILGVNTGTAMKLIKSQLPYIRVGRLYLVEKSDFEKWLAREKRACING